MPGPKAFDDDISFGREPEQQSLPRRLLRVQRNAALVGVEREKRGPAVEMRLAANERRLVTGLVSPARRLDLDRVGALIRQQLGAERAGGRVGQLEDLQLG